MGRKTNLLDEQASAAAKQLKVLLPERGRGAAKNFLAHRMRDVPRLNGNPKTKPTADQKTEWRTKLLIAIEDQLVKYPPMCADVMDILTKDTDFVTGDWLARRRLGEAGAKVDRSRTPSVMMREAADWGKLDTELMLSMNDFYTQQALAAGNGTAAAWQFDLPTYLIGRLSVGQSMGKALDGHTVLALVNSITRLPHRRFSPAANETMLTLAVQRSEQLLANQKPKDGGPKREDIWQAHLRAGIHLASHYAANGNLARGREYFDLFDDRCRQALAEFPKSVPLWGANLRLVHKWFKYEQDVDNGNGRSMVRGVFNARIKDATRAVGSKQQGTTIALPQNINIRIARFERDAGSKKLGYKFIRIAVAQNRDNPWALNILQSWLDEDREKPVKRAKRTMGKGPVRPNGVNHDKREIAVPKRVRT